jgi:hypothetical protein
LELSTTLARESVRVQVPPPAPYTFAYTNGCGYARFVYDEKSDTLIGEE